MYREKFLEEIMEPGKHSTGNQKPCYGREDKRVVSVGNYTYKNDWLENKTKKAFRGFTDSEVRNESRRRDGRRSRRERRNESFRERERIPRGENHRGRSPLDSKEYPSQRGRRDFPHGRGEERQRKGSPVPSERTSNDPASRNDYIQSLLSSEGSHLNRQSEEIRGPPTGFRRSEELRCPPFGLPHTEETRRASTSFAHPEHIWRSSPGIPYPEDIRRPSAGFSHSEQFSQGPPASFSHPKEIRRPSGGLPHPEDIRRAAGFSYAEDIRRPSVGFLHPEDITRSSADSSHSAQFLKEPHDGFPHPDETRRLSGGFSHLEDIRRNSVGLPCAENLRRPSAGCSHSKELLGRPSSGFPHSEEINRTFTGFSLANDPIIEQSSRYQHGRRDTMQNISEGSNMRRREGIGSVQERQVPEGNWRNEMKYTSPLDGEYSEEVPNPGRFNSFGPRRYRGRKS